MFTFEKQTKNSQLCNSEVLCKENNRSVNGYSRPRQSKGVKLHVVSVILNNIENYP